MSVNGGIRISVPGRRCSYRNRSCRRTRNASTCPARSVIVTAKRVKQAIGIRASPDNMVVWIAIPRVERRARAGQTMTESVIA